MADYVYKNYPFVDTEKYFKPLNNGKIDFEDENKKINIYDVPTK